jgi:16S rRNA (adenine1518-N6/adenine1519-N6)-dimethyltransferase
MTPKALFDQYRINPKKSLGQNFLHDPAVLEKIASAADLPPDATVVEIGPGTGSLTMQLAETTGRVIAIELDDRLQPILAAQLAPYPNVTVHYADVLAVDVAALAGPDPFIVVANVPYYITSAILRHLLEAPVKPLRLVLTVQLEIAERLVAGPGDLSLLAVSVQFYGRPQIVTRLKAGAFWPRPEVDSAVLRIDVYDTPPVDVPSDEAFFRVVRAGFSQKRKQLKNALAGGLRLDNQTAAELLESAEIDSRRRAETLALEEWARLAHVAG